MDELLFESDWTFERGPTTLSDNGLFRFFVSSVWVLLLELLAYSSGPLEVVALRLLLIFRIIRSLLLVEDVTTCDPDNDISGTIYHLDVGEALQN